MRAKDFTKPVEEEIVVEVVPAIAAAVGRVGASMGSAAAKAGAKLGTKAMGKAANVAQGLGKQAVKAIQKSQNDVAQSVLKKGNKLSLPKQGGAGEEEFDIDDVKGDQVILKNPKPGPGEPNAFVYTKKDLDSVVKQKADQAVGTPAAQKVV